MTELRVALRAALHLIVILVLSRCVDPFISRLVPFGGAIAQEAISLIVTAFVLGLAGAFLWGEPKIVLEWTAHETREPLERIDLRIRESDRSGARLVLIAKGHAEKPLAHWILKRASRQGLKLQVTPKQAPVIFNVESSSRDDNDRPLAVIPPGARGVTLELQGDPPSRGGGWIWVRGRFTAREFLPGQEWDVDYKLACSTRFSTFLVNRLNVRSDVDKLTIQSR